MLLQKWDFFLDIYSLAHIHSEFHELCQYFKGIQTKVWRAPCLPVNTGFKKWLQKRSQQFWTFCFDFWFLWIWSTKPNVREEEIERNRAVQSGRDNVAEGWKDFKSVQMKAYKLPQLAKWHQAFHSVPVVHSLIEHKNTQRGCGCASKQHLGVDI